MQRLSMLVTLCLFLLLFLSASSCITTGADSYTNGNPTSNQQTTGTDYRSMAYQDAINAGIPATYFVRQINQESGFNPYAYSSEGAIGIAQILQSTANAW